MTFVTRSRYETNGGEAHALRRYIASRAAGRTMPEYSRWDTTLRAWVASSDVEATGRCDGKAFRQVHRPGMPWCMYLGIDTVIAEDTALAAFLELHVSEGHDWNRLLGEVTRNRTKALKDWRQKGREALYRARAEREGVRVAVTLDPVIAALLKPGTGRRTPLKKGKRD